MLSLAFTLTHNHSLALLDRSLCCSIVLWCNDIKVPLVMLLNGLHWSCNTHFLRSVFGFRLMARMLVNVKRVTDTSLEFFLIVLYE